MKLSMPPKITSPESICTPHVVSGHRGAGSRCWWVLLVGGGAALRCRLPLGGLEQGGDTEAHGYPRGRGAVVGVTGHPRAAPPPAQRDLKASWLVSPQEPSEECARKSTTSPRTRITSRTRPSISSVSPPLCAAPEPRPQQPPSSPQLAAGRGVAAAAPTRAPTRRDTGSAQPAGKHGGRLRGPRGRRAPLTPTLPSKQGYEAVGASTEVSELAQLLTARGKGPPHPLPLLRGCCWSGRCAELPVL